MLYTKGWEIKILHTIILYNRHALYYVVNFSFFVCIYLFFYIYGHLMIRSPRKPRLVSFFCLQKKYMLTDGVNLTRDPRLLLNWTVNCRPPFQFKAN